jgi:hypothetical protein
MANINLSADMDHDELAQIPYFLKKLLSGGGSSPESSPDDSGSSAMPPTDNGGDPGAAAATGAAPVAASDRIPANDGTAPPDSKLTALQKIMAGNHDAMATAANTQIPDPNIDLGQGQVIPPSVGAIAQSGGQNDAANTPERPSFQERHGALMKILGLASEFAQDAGPGVGSHTFGEGFQTAEQQPYLRQQREAAAAKSRADLADTQSQTALRSAQAGQLANSYPVDVPDGHGGTMRVYIPQKDISKYASTQATDQSREKVADIAAMSREEVAKLRASVQSGKVITKSVYLPDGSVGIGAFDAKTLEPVGVLKGAIGAAWLQPVQRNSDKIIYDAAGNPQRIGVTSTTRRDFKGATFEAPGAPQPTQNTPQATQGAQVQQTAQPATNPARALPARGVRNATPVLGADGQPMQGPKSTTTGYAFDPQSGNTVLTTQGEFQQQGLQDFRKVPQGEIEKDRKTVVRLQDVNTKTDRYANDFSDDVTDRDRMNMSAIIADDRLHLGLSETKIPTGWLGKLTDSELYHNLSPTAKARTLDYFQAREALSGYNTVLTGSARGSDKNLELQLQALPNPLWTPDEAQLGFQRWRENLGIVNRGLPILPGVNDGAGGSGPKTRTATPQRQSSGGQNVAPEGTIIQNGNQRQIKQGGQWIPYRGQ